LDMVVGMNPMEAARFRLSDGIHQLL